MNLPLLKLVGKKLRPPELALIAKWLLNIKRKEFSLKEFKFYIDPISDFGLRIQEDGKYEPSMTENILQLLNPGDTFIDLGANEGFFSVLASYKVGKKGTVITIEPQQRLWEVIIKNFELNDCINCKLVPYGVDEESGTSAIFLYTSLNTGASSLKGFNFKIRFSGLRKKIYGISTIKTKSLDEIIESTGVQQVKLIKIDIEGYEFKAVKGASKALRNKTIEYLLIEIHPTALSALNQSQEMLLQYLLNYGYSGKMIERDLFLFQH